MPREIPVSLRLCWSDPVTGAARSVPLEGALRLGSHRQQNDVVLPFPSVEAFHAEILGDRTGGWDLVALGPRRLKVNGTMTSRARLTAGTQFSVGPVAFHVRPDEPAARRRVSSTGSRPAFPPPPAAPTRRPAAALAVLVAATAVAALSALRDRPGEAPGAPARTAATAPAPPGRSRPKAKAQDRTSLLEAGSVATASADAQADAPPVVLVKVGGSWVPVPGFFVTAGGLLVTNQRLPSRAEAILVRAAGAEAPASARVVASDPLRDLALLEVPVSGPVAAARLDDEEALRAAALALGVPAAEVRAFVGAHR
jgi:hypothetical protein